MIRDGPGAPQSSRSSSRISKHGSHISNFKELSLLERHPDSPSVPAVPSPSPSAQPQLEASSPGERPGSLPDYVYLHAAAIFQSLQKEKAASHRVISYGRRSDVKVPEVKNEALHRLAYKLAFNTLKYQELLEDIMIDSCFYLSQSMPDDLMSLVAVMLYDFQDRKFLPHERTGSQKEEAAEPAVRDVEECLLRFKTKLAASLARCRIKHDLLTIDCILPEKVRQRQERASTLAIYAWINTLRTSMEEVCDVLRSAGFIRVTSIGQLEGQAFCQDPHCMDLLVFPACVKGQLYHTNLLSEYKLIIQDKACCVGPWAVRPLLEEGRDVLVAGSFSVSTLVHVAAVVARARTCAHTHSTQHSRHTHCGTRVFACIGELSDERHGELRKLLSNWACNNVRLLPEALHAVSVSDPRVQKVQVILLTPHCSLSALSNPVDYLLQESGDTELLQDLSQGSVSQVRLHTLISQQRRDLQHALRFPKVQAVVYSTCSSFPEENEEVVQNVLSLNEQDMSQLQPFRLSSPPLRLREEEDRGESGFFKLEPSEKTNGCFLAVLIRQSDLEVTETAQEVLARATASGLLDGIQPSEPIKKEGRGLQTRKGPSCVGRGSDVRPRASLSNQSRLTEFLSREMKASRSAPAVAQDRMNGACSVRGKAKPTSQHSSKPVISNIGSASNPALALSPACKNMTRMLVSATANNRRAPPPVAPAPCPPKSRQEVLCPVALTLPPMLFPCPPPPSARKGRPPPPIRRNPTLSYLRWKNSPSTTNTLPHTWSSSNVRHPRPWF